MVSVCILTFNRPYFLKFAIESVLSQTYNDFEFLILDNGSDVSTKQLVDSFTDPRIKYYKNEINDISFVNFAFQIAKGDYLVISHDDDIMDHLFLQRQVSILDEYPDVSMVATAFRHIDLENKVINKNVLRIKKDKIFRKYDYIKYYLIYGNILACPTMMFRLNTIREQNINFRCEVGPMADLYLSFQMNCLESKIYLISEVLYGYRVHVNQDSRLNGINMQFKIIKHVEQLLKNVGQNKLAFKYKQSALSQIVFSLFLNLFFKGLSFKSLISYLHSVYLGGFRLSQYLFIWTFKAFYFGIRRSIYLFFLRLSKLYNTFL